MNKQDYIGISLTKKFHKAGVELYSEYCFNADEELEPFGQYPAYSYYDIINKYAKVFFGEGRDYECNRCSSGDDCECLKYENITMDILGMLQQNKPQEEIDKYIEEVTILLK